jgi:hypothetical protein
MMKFHSEETRVTKAEKQALRLIKEVLATFSEQNRAGTDKAAVRLATASLAAGFLTVIGKPTAGDDRTREFNQLASRDTTWRVAQRMQ